MENSVKIFIDTEFNGFKGELISIALVDEAGREFYRALQCAEPVPWVAANVMPVLGIGAVEIDQLQADLEWWLAGYDAALHLVADWPEDVQHFCALLITGPGMRINTPPMTMEVRRDLDAISRVPHNALEDAKAIRELYLSTIK